MKMNKASDYALVLLAKLESSQSGDAPHEEWVSVRVIAKEIGIPNRFLSNIVHKLVQAKILESHRGAHGGIKLAMSAKEITIGGVLHAMQDPMGIVDCIEHPGMCPLENHCDVQKFWSVTHAIVLSALKHITLKEITSYFKGEKHATDYT